MVIGGGAGAVDAVLLASAVIPPLVVLVVVRVAWIWAKSQDEGAPVVFRDVLRRALWLDRSGDRDQGIDQCLPRARGRTEGASLSPIPRRRRRR
jgi:hypothetical protein